MSIRMPQYFFSALLLVIFLGSCQEFLEEVPASFASPENSYETANDAEAAITGAYALLQSPAIAGVTTQFHLTDVQKPSFFNSQGGMGTLTMNGNNTQFVLAQWLECYEGINAANMAIRFVPEIDMNESRRAELVAEARFIRAYLYYRLVRLFGAVPLRTVPTLGLKDEDLQIPEASPDEVYAQIVADLEFGMENLPATTTFPSRASQGAAKSLLSSVYLTRGSIAKRDNTGGEAAFYELARSLSGEVIASGNYDLVPYYPDAFIPENKNHAEMIFDVAAQSGGIDEGSVLGMHMGLQGPPAIGGSWGTVRATQWYHTMFEEGDIVRREWSAPHDRVLGNGSLRTNYPEMNGQPWKIGKFRRWPVRDPTFTIFDWGGHWPVLRFAEVLMINAEANNELSGPTEEVLSTLNRVRARARNRNTGEVWEDILPRDIAQVDTVLLDLTNEDLPTKEATLSYIQDERAREFGGEFKRWFDLVRWGIYEERIRLLNTVIPPPRTRTEDNWELVAQNVGPRHLLMPKPNAEIRANPSITQNAGY